MFVIYPYKLGSHSANALREALQNKTNTTIKLVKPDGRYRPKQRHIIINWGNTTIPNWTHDQILNKSENIKLATNKIEAFKQFSENEVSHVEWTINKEVAELWISEGFIVVARATVTGHSGVGITLHGTTDFPDPLPNVPLYTKYKKKKAEYRVHVVNGKVIDVVQKKKKRERTDEFNQYIRNLGHDWVFARDGVTLTPELEDLATRAVASLGLAFGAVDIIYNQRENQYYVLEVNSAPGLEGTTLTKYTEAFVNEYA